MQVTMAAIILTLTLMLLMESPPADSTFVPEPCPHGCRCTSVPISHARHRWHRLLAAYRMQRLVYGHQRAKVSLPMHHFKHHRHAPTPGTPGGGEQNEQAVTPPSGREMTCMGLSNMPDHIPPDVNKITMYGDSKRGSSYGRPLRDSPATVVGAGGVRVYPPPADRGSSPRRGHGTDGPSNEYHQITVIRKYAFRRSKSMKDISIEGNRIKVIHPSDFDMLENLRTLHLRNNRIKLLWPKCFQGLENLAEIDLTSNHIKSLTKSLFTDTPKLRKLLLGKNRIRGIHGKLLRPLKFLEEVDLSDNLIKDLPKDVFTKLLEMKEINLNNNNLQIIHSDWFTDMQQLTSLSLRGNRIRKLEPYLFSSLSSLTHLNLEKNEISSLPLNVFEEVNGLKRLSLSKNNISNIPSGAFQNLGHLEELHLDSNRISGLINGSLNGLQRLLTLSLNGNNLLEINADALESIKKIQRLYFAHNNIKIIRSMNFYGLLDLRELKLDHNEIKVIEEEGFAISQVHTYSKLTWLYLHYNKLERVTMKMLYGLSYLKFLNLCHNSISIIHQGALSMMGRLHTLILNDNILKYINAGEFKQQRHLQHMNLARNMLRILPLNVFLGLENLRDLTLEKNFIDEISEDVFADAMRLTSLNVRSNRLSDLDLEALLSRLHKLRYLDVARNSISEVTVPKRPTQRGLHYLSLSDNNLETLSENVSYSLTPGGTTRLYGNPWSCDCRITWLRDLVDEGQAKLPEPDEIVCKTPKHLTGEQIGALSPNELDCPQSDGGAHRWSREDKPSVSCSFMSHAKNQSTRQHVKSRKGDLLDWMVTLYTNQSSCSGVQLASDWLLTPSECWKEYSGDLMWYQTGSFDKNVEFQQSVLIENIVFYPGPLDIALIKFKDINETLVNQHVFPCILSTQGGATAKKNGVSGILEAQIPRKSSKSTKVRFRSLALRTVRSAAPDAFCSNEKTQMCAKAPSRKEIDVTRLVTKDAPFFVKVGRTRWSLAGLGASANQDAVNFELLAPAIHWMDNILF